jgi:hypothetical protein
VGFGTRERERKDATLLAKSGPIQPIRFIFQSLHFGEVSCESWCFLLDTPLLAYNGYRIARFSAETQQFMPLTLEEQDIVILYGLDRKR